MRPPLPAPELGEQYVALRAERSQVLLERSHPLPDQADPLLELGFVN